MQSNTVIDYVLKAKEGDEQAKAKIFEQNKPLIRSIIRRFKNKGIEYDDLYQIACIGFLKAIKNFDDKFNVKFSTYSVPMIIGEIKRYIRDNGSIKVSRTMKILANKMNRFIDDYQAKNNSSPSIELLAKEFDIPQEEVVITLESSRMPLSIYDKFEDNDDSQMLMDKIPSDFTEETLVDNIQIKEIINELPEREKKIIEMRYFRDKTQGEVAMILGVSQVQVSRLESKILTKIRLRYD